jgi:hypothetical protein
MIFVIACIVVCSSCATFNAGMEGKYEGQEEKNYNAERVTVMFEFSHYRQTIGYDAIPKLEHQWKRIEGFDDFFLDALNEISNIKKYSTFTNYSTDVSDTKRRDLKDSLLNSHDFIVKVKINKEKSFSRFFWGIVGSTLTATTIPVRYQYLYKMHVEVYNKEHKLLKTYSRQAKLNKWVETFLVFWYPFHHEKRKKEELHVAFLHDIFKQIEAEKVLVKE